MKYGLYTHKCRPSTKGFGPGAVGHWKRRENPLWTSVVTTTMMRMMKLIMKTVAIVVQHRGSILANEFTEHQTASTVQSKVLIC